MSQWQPIATAPLDGTLLDLWIEADGARFRAVDYRWSGTHWQWKHGGSLEDNFANLGMRATHWMRVLAPEAQ